jgi:hypothetical protein
MLRIGDVKSLPDKSHTQPFIDMKITKHAGIEISSRLGKQLELLKCTATFATSPTLAPAAVGTDCS